MEFLVCRTFAKHVFAKHLLNKNFLETSSAMPKFVAVFQTKKCFKVELENIFLTCKQKRLDFDNSKK